MYRDLQPSFQQFIHRIFRPARGNESKCDSYHRNASHKKNKWGCPPLYQPSKGNEARDPTNNLGPRKWKKLSRWTAGANCLCKLPTHAGSQ